MRFFIVKEDASAKKKQLLSAKKVELSGRKT